MIVTSGATTRARTARLASALSKTAVVIVAASTMTAIVQSASAQAPISAQTAAPTAPPASAPAANATTGLVLDEKQTAAVKDVSKYFNDMKSLKGTFNQTNADGKKLKGKFFIKQPGKFRFDYSSGSKMIIVSDGKYLSIQDLDIKSDNSWEIDRTPFRILLRKDVDLLRDATVLEVQDVDDLIIVSVQDKSPDTPGRIKLFLSKKPTIELKEWVTTDAQGIDTRIEIADLNKTDDIAADMFVPPSPTIQKAMEPTNR